MEFKETDITESIPGAILAHSLSVAGRRLKKGKILTEEDLDFLRRHRSAPITTALLDRDDVHEDRAAARLAAAIAGAGIEVSKPIAGRVNLFARQDGLLCLKGPLGALNQLHESLTLATLPAYEKVSAKQLAATIKVIPFGVPESQVAAWETQAESGSARIEAAPFRAKKVALIQTQLPDGKAKILTKTKQVLEERLEALGSRLESDLRCSHDASSVARTLAESAQGDLIVISGAGAITDRRDVVPAGLVAAGGEVLHFGMPVDPGNLLMLGRWDGIPVIGMPSCARSPKLNGFDWILQRLCADLAVSGEEIRAMGVGGLLKEIPTRPMPRVRPESDGLRNPSRL